MKMDTIPRFILFVCLASAACMAQRQLAKYNVDRSQISVSGVSSGAAMATQVHVAYSTIFMGVGVLAGNPYYCAEGSSITATNACMSFPERIDIPALIKQTNKYASSGDVDATMNMYNDKVFIFAGTLDSTVNPGIAGKVEEYYRNYVNGANIRTVTNVVAEHTVPTIDYGNACTVSRSPFISKCNYNAAFEILNHIYGGGLTRPTGSVPLNGDFYLFDQSEFFYISPPALSSMDKDGYVYVPSGCVFNQNRCKLHVAIHGCRQGRHVVDDEFAMHGGYNEVGELNNIIILYPQAIAVAVNPMGCWDWWGYTINNYATKGANQPLAIKRFIDRIS